MINSQFHKLNIEKQQRIINAALNEFVQSGYEKASTNKIVKNAGISKGSLFNYFRNKKELYLYLIDYAVEIIEAIYDQIDYDETDIFKRLENIGFIKFHFQKKYPLIFDFLASTGAEEAIAVKNEIKEKTMQILSEGFTKIYQNIDFSKFRDDIDIEKAIDILNWTMHGFGDKAVKQINSFQDVNEVFMKEWESYANILKLSFYKEGAL